MYTKSLSTVPRTIGGLLEDLFQNGISLWDYDSRSDSRPVNIQDTEKAFVIHLIAPGLEKDNFRISVDKNVLTIACEHKEAEQEETGKWLRNEYRITSFKRSFTLNEKIDVTGITAGYTNGILNVTLPKKETAVPPVQSIPVN